MIIRNFKNILSSIVITAFLFVQLAPAGMCLTTMPQTTTQNDRKPVLRTSNALKLEGDISLTKGNPKVNLSLRDSDVKQVLRMFADKAGLNIIFHESVDNGSESSQSSNSSSSGTPKVTMDLVNVPLNDAFRLVLQVTNLTYYIDQNTMVVMSASAAQTLNLSKQELMIVPVKYVDAAVLASFLNKNVFSLNRPGLSNSNIVTTNPSTNELLIFGTSNDYIMAKKVIEQFDKKPLEETFIVNHSTPKEMAELLCTNLFKSFKGVNKTTDGSTESSDDSSSDDSSTESSSLVLGQGIIACQYENSVTTDNLESINLNNLTITYFPQRGTINTIGGSVQQIEMIKDFILKNDKKQPQAFLEVSLIELNASGQQDFQNTWDIWSKFFSGSFNGTSATSDTYPTFLRGSKDPETSLSKYSGILTLTYSMSYLISNGKGRVLANPKIIITNGQMSKIDLSSDYVKEVTSQIVESSYSSVPTVQKTYTIGDDEGIIIEMTPFISPDGYVTLDIKPEYSTVKEKVTDTNPETGNHDLVATLLQRRNLELKNIRIKDGETLVIGGLIQETETQTISKIPVLGDLPGVGMFFRNTNSVKQKQELVIMITPKIINDSEDIMNQPEMTL